MVFSIPLRGVRGAAAALVTVGTSERTGEKGRELGQGKFHFHFRKRFFTQSAVRHWDRFPIDTGQQSPGWLLRKLRRCARSGERPRRGFCLRLKLMSHRCVVQECGTEQAKEEEEAPRLRGSTGKGLSQGEDSAAKSRQRFCAGDFRGAQLRRWIQTIDQEGM